LLNGGSLYVFRKPAGGWQAVNNEVAIMKVPQSAALGTCNWHNNGIAISDDQNTIAAVDPYYYTKEHPDAAIFIFHKEPNLEWTGNEPSGRASILLPNELSGIGSTGVEFFGDRVVSGTLYGSPIGSLYVFHNPSGDHLTWEIDARLQPFTDIPDTYGLFGHGNICKTDYGIFSYGASVNTSYSVVSKGLYFFPPQTGNWENAQALCNISLPNQGDRGALPYVVPFQQGILVSYQDVQNTGQLVYITPSLNDWCNPVIELVYTQNISSGQAGNLFGIDMVLSTSDIAIRKVPNESSLNNMNNVLTLSKDFSGEQIISKERLTSTGHYYGTALEIEGDMMFVGATQDPTAKRGGGAVYVYQKQGKDWVKVNKILPPIKEARDDVFGAAIASHGNYLAIGAPGFGEKGAILVYQKETNNWSSIPEPQRIILPESTFVVDYGYNVDLYGDWLVIPFISMKEGARFSLAFYKNESGIWTLKQDVEVSFSGLNRSGSPQVSMRGNITVFSGFVFELQSNDTWFPIAQLAPSDPEPIQIASDFSHWITNGSNFGRSVWVNDNHIFIGAPTRDVDGIWDVGAVYVYTKLDGESWRSTTESAKLVPRIKDQSGLFGYAIRNVANSVLVGAPGADYDKSGNVRGLPGRSFVIQAKDYFWQNTIDFQDFTGDSFIKDYFGISVGADELGFIIGSPLDDSRSGKYSGSVYVSELPPRVKLLQPTCLNSAPVELLGYPFGGTWSGVGVTHTNSGYAFNPMIAGAGLHELEYSTPSCFYIGKLLIEVKGTLEVQVTSPQEYRLCQSPFFGNRSFSVNAQSNVVYRWFFRSGETGAFTRIDQHGNSATVSSIGYYYVQVSNGACSINSPIFSLLVENNPITIQPIPVICNTNNQPIEVSPTGGSWQGLPISSNVIQTSALSNGAYTITYSYTSPNNCSFTRQASVQINRLPSAIIQRSADNICITGSVQLSISPLSNMAVDWYFKEGSSGEFTKTDSRNTPLNAVSIGEYYAVYRNSTCMAQTPSILLTDKFSPVVARVGNLCVNGSATLSIPNLLPNYQVSWFFRKDESENYSILGESASTVTTETQGIYYASVMNSNCSATTQPVTINDTMSRIVTPKEVSTTVCPNESFSMIVDFKVDDTFTWYHKATDRESWQELTDTSPILNIESTGYYKVVISNGPCYTESPVKYFDVKEIINPFVPTVFTPNADGSNDRFYMQGIPQEAKIIIINRNGQTVFEGDNTIGWNGGESPSGVYFWECRFSSCKNEPISYKGYIQLIR
jgi:gliding motility-associated-like protein